VLARRAVLEEGAVALAAGALMPAASRGAERRERRIPRTGEALPAVGLGT